MREFIHAALLPGLTTIAMVVAAYAVIMVITWIATLPTIPPAGCEKASCVAGHLEVDRKQRCVCVTPAEEHP